MQTDMWNETEMLTQLRRKSGEYETQRQMAEFLGISESMLSYMLKGERSVTDEIAQKLFGRRRVVLFVVPVEDSPVLISSENGRK